MIPRARSYNKHYGELSGRKGIAGVHTGPYCAWRCLPLLQHGIGGIIRSFGSSPPSMPLFLGASSIGLFSNEGFDLRTHWFCSAKCRAEEGNSPQNSLRASLGGAATSQWPPFSSCTVNQVSKKQWESRPQVLLSAQLKVGTST